MKAKLGRDELGALKRVDDQSRRLERAARGRSVEALIAEERRASFGYDGRSVFGWGPPPAEPASPKLSYGRISRPIPSFAVKTD
jgi:uncharacterized protein